MKNLAIIPVRGGSKRIRNKNTLEFFGIPLFLHSYYAAEKSALFEDIVVSTNSQIALDICREKGINVPFVRPAELSSDTALLNHVVAHTLQEMTSKGRNYDNFCLLWATAPLRNSDDIINAYNLLVDSEDIEAVVTITDNNQYDVLVKDDKDRLKRLYTFSDLENQRSQDMPKMYYFNGAMSWVRCKAWNEQKTWWPRKVKGYYMPVNKSVDVNVPEDLELLSYYYKKQCE